jgi:soluble P-type ATPase
MIEIEIPGVGVCRFLHLVLDVNGTIAKDGKLIRGVQELLAEIRRSLDIHLITADTHGSQDSIDQLLGIAAVRIPVQNQVKAKRNYIEKLGCDTVVAMGNGANDSSMLEGAALGIAIMGPEGSSVEALLKAKIAAPDIQTALELLLYPKRLIATLRR